MREVLRRPAGVPATPDAVDKSVVDAVMAFAKPPLSPRPIAEAPHDKEVFVFDPHDRARRGWTIGIFSALRGCWMAPTESYMGASSIDPTHFMEKPEDPE